MADLETVLMQMSRHGRPKLFLQQSGWYCSVDMFVAAVGAKFDVASDFGKPSALSAAEECAARIETMLCQFSDNAKAITHD